MPGRIMIGVNTGPLSGTKFAVDERMICTVGRAKDCLICIPKEADGGVSRYHCLFDVSPPNITVRDLGSKNGTYVNQQNIALSGGVSGAGGLETRPVALQDGDIVQISDTIFQINIEKPDDGKATGLRVCLSCGRYIEMEEASTLQGKLWCPDCLKSGGETPETPVNPESMDVQGTRQQCPVPWHRIIKPLGRGGMGMVYLIENVYTGVPMALKVMLSESAANNASVDRFLREVRICARLNHPNIVRLYDYGCKKGLYYCALEYCGGGSVEKLCDEKGGPFDLEDALLIIMQVLDGLIYAQSVEIPGVKLADGREVTATGIVHRDLKPENLFIQVVDGKQVVKIGDFGIAKAFDMSGLSGHTQQGVALGTPYFAPRQQIVNFKFAGIEVDVWAVAATLYYLLTGYPPKQIDMNNPIKSLLEKDPVPVLHRNPEIPSKLAELLDSALYDKGDLAFKKAADFRSALLDVI